MISILYLGGQRVKSLKVKPGHVGNPGGLLLLHLAELVLGEEGELAILLGLHWHSLLFDLLQQGQVYFTGTEAKEGTRLRLSLIDKDFRPFGLSKSEAKSNFRDRRFSTTLCVRISLSGYFK